MNRKNFVLSGIVGLLAIVTSGCAGMAMAGGAAAGAGTYVYMNGELSYTETASIDKTWEATRFAVDRMGLTPITVSNDALTARMRAQDSNGKDIYINLKSLAENQTDVRIRVGMFGDETMSERILSYIHKQLANPQVENSHTVIPAK